MSEVTAVVQHRRNHALVLDNHLFGFKTAHGVAGTSDLRHVKLLVQRVVRVFVLLFEPVESGLALGSVARRFAQRNHHEAVRCETADHSTVSARFGTATGSPNDNGMLLVGGETLGIRKDSATIMTGAFNIFDFHLVLILVGTFGKEYATSRFGFAGRRHVCCRACHSIAGT